MIARILFEVVKWVSLYFVSLSIILCACWLGSLFLPSSEDLIPAVDILIKGFGL